jgi:amino-acid N-acetyltransferase
MLCTGLLRVILEGDAMSEADVVLRPAQPEDLADVLALLEQAGLPVAGVEESFERFVVAEHDGRIVGVAGLEVHGSDGLLRSVAVADDWRGRGLGGALTEEILLRCSRDGLTAVYLLTETAASFFPRYGFVRIERESASDAVKQSAEFRELCPSSSVAMKRELTRRA